MTTLFSWEFLPFNYGENSNIDFVSIRFEKFACIPFENADMKVGRHEKCRHNVTQKSTTQSSVVEIFFADFPKNGPCHSHSEQSASSIYCRMLHIGSMNRQKFATNWQHFLCSHEMRSYHDKRCHFCNAPSVLKINCRSRCDDWAPLSTFSGKVGWCLSTTHTGRQTL